MKKLTNYIVFHDKESFYWFIFNNPDTYTQFKYIWAGNKHNFKTEILNYSLDIHVAKNYPNNIEQYPSLLTFTAWYLLANNNICQTDYVGIFEYDVIFKEYPNPELKLDTIYGFKQRSLPDGMYLDAIPLCKNLFNPYQLISANIQPYWNCTSNFIMPKEFLKTFSNWYWSLIDMYDLIKHEKVSHYHERLINLFAQEMLYFNETLNTLEHKELNSHGIRL